MSCLKALKVDPSELQYASQLKLPSNDPQHHSTAFFGRLGLFEMLAVSEQIHEMVVDKATSRSMRQQAISEGMRTLQRCGWEQCKRNETTLEEVLRLADATDEHLEHHEPEDE